MLTQIMFIQMVRDLLEKNTINKNPVSCILETNSHFEDGDKLILEVGTVDKDFRIEITEI